MKRTTLLLLGLAVLAWLTPSELLAQRGGRGGGGGRGGFGGGGGGGFERGGGGGGFTSAAGNRGGGERGGGGNFGGGGFGGHEGGGAGREGGFGGGGGGREGGFGGGGGGREGGFGGNTANRPGAGGSGEQRQRADNERPNTANRPGGGGSGEQWQRGSGDFNRISGGGNNNIYRGGVNVRTGNTNIARNGTFHQTNVDVHNNAVGVRSNFNHYDCFNRGWYNRYPGAWAAAGWATGAAWRAATWPAMASYGAYAATPTYYDYGTSVVYQGDNVYVNGDDVGTTEQYSQQATQLAATGKQAQPSKDDDWMPLGVFAMVSAGQENSSDIFQLAVNKAGVIRGTYYNAMTDSSETVYGSVDQKTQRAAWTVADKKTPVYEAGIANLTKDETTMLVHYNNDRSQQYNLVRVKQPEDGKGGGK